MNNGKYFVVCSWAFLFNYSQPYCTTEPVCLCDSDGGRRQRRSRVRSPWQVLCRVSRIVEFECDVSRCRRCALHSNSHKHFLQSDVINLFETVYVSKPHANMILLSNLHPSSFAF